MEIINFIVHSLIQIISSSHPAGPSINAFTMKGIQYEKGISLIMGFINTLLQ